MQCKRIVQDWENPGHTKEIVANNHSYAWSGSIPCTGEWACVFCGQPEDPTDRSDRTSSPLMS